MGREHRGVSQVEGVETYTRNITKTLAMMEAKTV